MEPEVVAGLVGGAAGLLGAAAGLWVMVATFRGYFSRFVAVRPDPEVAPVSREELIRRILALNDPARPFSYRPDERYDIRAEWRLADASWWGVLQRNHLSAATADPRGGSSSPGPPRTTSRSPCVSRS